ncbi:MULTISPECIES: hypothetical protein [Clostridium]|uniref:Uncharacterized protein n=2 Tax=Clostridium TaxID=1485 RepID=A0A964RT13_9CLOT|nr:hypothetical protein [Clostridium chromiireducens]MVX67276.1 hypothetical protein [Clostridium chromiireducens]
MEKKVCQKCSNELSDDYTKKLCEECKVKRDNLVKNVVIGGVAAAAIVAIGLFCKSRSNAISDLAKSAKKIPIKRSTDVIHNVGKTAETESKNWLTKIDKFKLERALAEGKITDGILKSAKYELENGFVLVDDFLKVWSADSIISEFPNWCDKVKGVSGVQFADILKDAAKETPDVVNIDVFDKAVQVTFRSNSGKTKWNAFWNFENATGELTDKFVCNAPYNNAAVLRQFSRNVLKRLKNIVEE